jgi:phage terminase small subunit
MPVPELSNPKHEAFAVAYADLKNATKAAVRSGYSERAARQQGTRLLSNAAIRVRIDELLADLNARLKLSAERTLAEYAAVAHSDVGDILDFSGDKVKLRPARDIPERARRAISSVKVRRVVEGKGDEAQEVELIEFKLWSKPQGLQDVAKHQGLLKDGELVLTGQVDVSHGFDLSKLSGEQLDQLNRIVAVAGRPAAALNGHAEANGTAHD